MQNQIHMTRTHLSMMLLELCYVQFYISFQEAFVKESLTTDAHIKIRLNKGLS